MARNDFFLDPDEAQSFGNINFMRKSVKVRHTFPKNLKNPNGFEITKDISSIIDNSNSLSSLSNINQTNSLSGSQPQSNINISSSKPAASSNSMDLFRNMARNIGKRK